MTDRSSSGSRARREASVRRLASTLEHLVTAKPDWPLPEWQPPEALKEAMQSQGALANYEDPALGLVGMSLNTQKAIAEQCCGGYAALNALRLAALDAMAKRQSRGEEPCRGTKESLRREGESLAARNALLEHDLGQLTWAFGRLAAYARAQAQEIGDPHAMARFTKELRSIESGLSLLKRPLGTNVIAGDFGA